MPVATTTLPIIGSMLSGVTGGAGVESLFGVEQVLFVDKTASPTGTEDGTLQDPYQNIQDAIDAAVLLTPAAGNRILVFTWPGVYDEALDLDDDYIYLHGADRGAVIVEQDGDTPLTITSGNNRVTGMTFRVVTNVAPIVEISGTADFLNCAFVAEAEGDSATVYNIGNDALFQDCAFVDATGDYVVVTSEGTTELRDCSVFGGIQVDSGVMTLENTEVTSSRGASGSVRATAASDVVISVCRIANSSGPPVMLTNAGVELTCINSVLTSGQGDAISSSAVITTAAIVENVTMLGGGISSNVPTASSVKYVGSSGMRDWYSALSDVVGTIAAASTVTIELLKDVTITSTITAPAATIEIDACCFTVTGPAASSAIVAPTGCELTLSDGTFTGRYDITGDGQLTVDNAAVSGQVRATSGTSATAFIDVVRSEVIGSGNYGVAIQIEDADPNIYVEHSRAKGAAGSNAVYWNGVTNDNLQIRYSTLWHGSGAANNPFGRSGAQQPSYRSHHSEYNLDPQTGGNWTNLIAVAQRFDGYDTNTDY